MSQHWHHQKPYSVLVGFDRPCQGFFLVIYPFEPIDMDEPLWSNLEQAPSHPATFDAFAPVLERFGITLPAPLYEALREDAARYSGPKHSLSNLFG